MDLMVVPAWELRIILLDRMRDAFATSVISCSVELKIGAAYLNVWANPSISVAELTAVLVNTSRTWLKSLNAQTHRFVAPRPTSAALTIEMEFARAASATCFKTILVSFAFKPKRTNSIPDEAMSLPSNHWQMPPEVLCSELCQFTLGKIVCQVLQG